MATITLDDQVKPPQAPPGAFRVLVTGFVNSPGSPYGDNPSWLAVEPLQNTILHTDIHTKSSPLLGGITQEPRPIHITALKTRVIYKEVLDIVSGLHARPPHLPTDAPADCAPPPPGRYNFVFHLGDQRRGPLSMERVGHKVGYHMTDAKGQLPPVVPVLQGSGEPGAEGIPDGSATGPASVARVEHGFGVGYETHIDVTRLVQDLKKSGVEQIYTSVDAGHFLCDFIYYGSLAEVRRSGKPYNTQVLFLHCPPVNQPLSTEEVRDAIKRIVVWVCSEQQLD